MTLSVVKGGSVQKRPAALAIVLAIVLASFARAPDIVIPAGFWMVSRIVPSEYLRPVTPDVAAGGPVVQGGITLRN
jgi:hypothetical protein